MPVYRLPGTNGEVAVTSDGDDVRARATRTVCRLARDDEELADLLAMLGLDMSESTSPSGSVHLTAP